MLTYLTGLAKKIIGDANDREVRRIQPLVARIAELEPSVAALDDAALRGRTAAFRTKLDNGATLDDLLPDAFATVREAAKRTLGLRHYDVQMIGGIVLHQGRIAEMKTGEGKTLVGTCPVYLNALAGKGVHVVTVNDYLAARDAEWMGQVYRFLGMSVGTILSGERSEGTKRAAYAADITYGTNNEFGFDYLRDNMKYRLEDCVQRGHSYAIVDEVDSILIDEARTPLIISGPAEASIDLYYIVDAVIPMLVANLDFTVDEKAKSVTLTDEGVTKIEDRLGVDNLFTPQNIEVLHHVNQALKAHHVYRRDREYMVIDGQCVIIDEFTGRKMFGRRWSDGLHQAIEAKERVQVQPESQVYATITFQNLYRLYAKLAGMTGTAYTEAAEFASIYKLDTVVIPTHRPVARIDHDDIVYKTEMEKFRAVVSEIEDCRGRGQPVLVGTTSVEKSEILAKLLERRGVAHEVLNAKNHAREAQIVAQAGRLGAVTISTNMAGRGTDIKLGGNPEEMARADVDPAKDADGYVARLAHYVEQCRAEQKAVLEAGGLHIVGTERHDSRRVDNQLRGRSGRQGDPGSSRFYLCLEDQLLRLFANDRLNTWMERMGMKDDEPIEHRWVTSAIENAQKKVEGHHFQMRKNLLEYDDVLNYQRKGVYGVRQRALAGDGIRPMIDEALDSTISDIMDETCPDGVHPEQWDVVAMKERLERVFGIKWTDPPDQLRDLARRDIRERMSGEAKALLEARVAEAGADAFNTVARMLLLQFTDQLWRDHLLAIDRLRQGIGLRGYGQRNPLLEYKREAYHMFLAMEAMRDESVLTRIFNTAVEAQPAAPAPAPRGKAPGKFSDVPMKGSNVTEGPRIAPQPAPALPPRRPKQGAEARAFAVANGIGRNDPCPCGSGNKLKKCCGKEAADDAAAAT
jgi:preprotein translocase subunit SecA